ncbi:unnamed protein product [Calicophoron daubneyi]|uniref:SHSP domain-containing protein n=1 Tax=Calicophoron daubneyi TaxID=300641 RepID=A0AAV2U058_CALDB
MTTNCLARTICIQRDRRTFEQKHKDLVSNLGRRYNNFTPQQINEPPIPDSYQRLHLHSQSWSNAVKQWVCETHRQWSDEMNRLREEMLVVVPVDEFLDNSAGVDNDISSVLSRMDKQMQIFDAEIPHEPAEESGGDQHTNGCGSHVTTNSKTLDFLRSAYEPGDDGRIYFKVRFNMERFRAEDIEVNTSGYGLTTNATLHEREDTEHGSRRFQRTIYIPESIDEEHLHCSITNDKILTVEAPVIHMNYNELTFNEDRRLCLRPTAASTVGLRITGTSGRTILPGKESGHVIHLEIPIDSEFKAGDVHISVDINRLLISGRKQCVDETDGAVYTKEFKDSYSTPETVDIFSTRCQQHDSTLLIEAPLLHSY